MLTDAQKEQKAINFVVNSTAVMMAIAAIGYAAVITTGIDGWERISPLFQFIMGAPTWALLFGGLFMVVDNERNQQV